MLMFEAWDMVATSVEYCIEEYDIISDPAANKLEEALMKCDGLMDLMMMKIDSMEDEITITRDEITEVLGYGK